MHPALKKLCDLHAQQPEAIPSWLWTLILSLIAKSPALIAVVEADIAAGKSFMQIIEDVLAALITPPAPTP